MTTDIANATIKVTTALGLVGTLVAVIFSWASTTEQLKTATKEIAALTTQMSEVKKANDEQHKEMQTQARDTELKLYGAITTLKLKRIMQ